MTDSLRDQLLKLGFKKPAPVIREAVKPHQAERKHKPGAAKSAASGRPPQHARRPAPAAQKPAPGVHTPTASRSQEEIDLARAYALRERQERADREQVKREAEAKAQARRELKQKLRSLLQGKAVNDPEADVMRHFPHGGKIKRVYVNAAQLLQVNSGELGVVQLEGRYLLVTRETALAAAEIASECLILLLEPGAASDDDWALQVPPDL